VDTTIAERADALRTEYRRNGVCAVAALISDDFLDRASQGMDDVVAGVYRSGREPLYRQSEVGETAGRLLKVAQPHYASPEIAELVRHPAIGELVATVLGASMVQVWAVDMLTKPPQSGESAKVGWHRDIKYMRYWEGELVTAWVGLGDTTVRDGAVRYLLGTHADDSDDDGDFFDTDGVSDSPRAADGRAEWYGEIKRGGVILHHPRILHASGANRSDSYRRALAIRMRTESSRPRPGHQHALLDHLDDDELAPVIYGGASR
jgi:ectoine hydroxylase-related dioxygenase (phytanoyl-CoA dioxygenase family)